MLSVLRRLLYKLDAKIVALSGGETSGSVLFSGGPGVVSEDNDKFFYSTAGGLRLLDKAHVPILSADTPFSVSSNDQVAGNAGEVTTSNHYIGANIDQKITATGANKWYTGLRTQIRVGGDYTGSGYIYGHWVDVCNRLNTTATPNVVALAANVNLEGPATESVGAEITSFRGSTVACPSFTGVRVQAANGYSTADSVIGVDSWVRAISSAATTTLGRGLRSRVSFAAGHTITEFRGLSLDSWSNSATVTTSYGIYADTSIDVGATKYFIYSLSASPSLITGPVQLGSSLTMAEISEPAAPAANGGTLFLADNGAGKTKLMIRFSSGASQQVAIEP